MSTLPREVHEVLEEEYVSMYGPLERGSACYTVEDVVDVAWAASILRKCGLGVQQPTKESLKDKLNDCVSELPVDQIDDSPALTSIGRSLLAQYAKLSETARVEGRLEELNRRIVDDALTGAVRPLRDVRLKELYRRLHERAADPGKARTAFCISGGGIRSATFALGVMQGLASAKILDKFDYLSTVSGGGYIGSWLSSWARRHPHGISGVQEDLASCDTATGGTVPALTPAAEPAKPAERDQKIEPEPQPMLHLREYSNYLSPRLGILSGDSWTMASLYVRNLLLNLLVLVPIFAAILYVPRAYAWFTALTSDTVAIIYPFFTVAFLAWAFAFIGLKRPVDFEAPPKKKTGDGAFIANCILPLMGAAWSLTLFWTDVANEQVTLMNRWILLGLLVAAVLSMTLVPFLLYQGRLRRAIAAAPRAAFGDDESLRKHLSAKMRTELWGAGLGLATASGLIVLLALKVFDAPLPDFSKVIGEALNFPPVLRTAATTPWSSLYTVFAIPAVMLVFFVQASIFVGISSKRNEDYDREWWGRAGAWLIAFAAAWTALAGIAVFGPVAIYNAPILLGSIGGLSGIAAGVLGFSGKTPANAKQKDDSGAGAKAGNAALGLAVPLFVVFFLSLISLGTTWLTQEVKPLVTKKGEINYAEPKKLAQFESTTRRVAHGQLFDADVQVTDVAKSPRVSMPELRSLHHLNTFASTTGAEVVAMILIAILAYWLSRKIGVNKFSMHALYRNRLIRAYLGASRYNRQPNAFTGFDDRDNLRMYQLRPELLWSTHLKNEEAFFDALKQGARASIPVTDTVATERRKLAQYLWTRLYDTTRRQLAAGVSASAIDAVIHNLNAIILDADERNLLEKQVELPAGFWALPEEGKTPYSAAMRNRAVLDHIFSAELIPMARPKDAPQPEEKAVARKGQGTFKATGEGVRRRAPLHVINMALNLVSGEKLAWQQRMAETFTSSPYHTGNAFLGYRDSRQYGGREGISIGSAVTISGAAASPNMGYHSSPAMGFLLTLFNVRLGSWLGNPGPAGQKVFGEGHPDSNLKPILFEAIGRTNDTYEWVYLSDGGHFENLGLYEMVLRRCHFIVLSDGGADPNCTFEDLGNAIRKIRTDFGVPIDIEETYMYPRNADSLEKEGRYVATATIRYQAVDGPGAVNGTLIYLKPGCYKEEYFPRDVYNYALESPQFPHEPTSDQFFSESQFESYRALGRHAINSICENYPKGARIPIVKEFEHVAHFAGFIEEKHRQKALNQPEPAKLIASAIRQLKA